MHLRLLRPANDIARLDATTDARGVEERARGMLVAILLGPDGPRELVSEGEPGGQWRLREAAS